MARLYETSIADLVRQNISQNFSRRTQGAEVQSAGPPTLTGIRLRAQIPRVTLNTTPVVVAIEFPGVSRLGGDLA